MSACGPAKICRTIPPDLFCISRQCFFLRMSQTSAVPIRTPAKLMPTPIPIFCPSLRSDAVFSGYDVCVELFADDEELVDLKVLERVEVFRSVEVIAVMEEVLNVEEGLTVLELGREPVSVEEGNAVEARLDDTISGDDEMLK